MLLKWKKQRHNLTETVCLKFEYNTGVILYRLIVLITHIQFHLNKRLYAYKLQLLQECRTSHSVRFSTNTYILNIILVL